jgi:rare lipoprotein A
VTASRSHPDRRLPLVAKAASRKERGRREALPDLDPDARPPSVVGSFPAEAASGQRSRSFDQRGEASFYGPGLHGRRTASGERFDQHKLTAAHPKLPFGTEVTVTNLENNRSVRVEINDRGPFTRNRAIDLSRAAARRIGITSETGTAPVRIESVAKQ